MAIDSTPAPVGAPWAQRPREPAGAYTAFCAWLYARHAPRGFDAPDRLTAFRPPRRSLRATAEYLRVRESDLATLAARHEWEARASAFDACCAEQHAARVADTAADQAARRAALLSEGEHALGLALSRLSSYLEHGNKDDLTALKALRIDMPRLLDTILHHRNESAKNTPARDEVDLSKLSDDELSAYEALVRKARR